jgi:hypothetical protein
MRVLSVICLLAATSGGAETKDDLLSFVNGDQLHGEFSGIGADSSLRWKRQDVGGEVKFNSSELRRVVLNGGEPQASLGGFSHIGLTNGDRIPGRILGLDGKRILIGTEFSGSMEFPRNRVGLLAPNPMGGKVLYHGPFAPAEWDMIDTKHPDGIPAAPAKDGKQDGIPRWKHAGSAWYWENEEGGTALVRRVGMPDRAVLRFDVAWKNRLSLAVGFHSDFVKTVQAEGDGEGGDIHPEGGGSVSLPGLFGDSYVLHLYSNYVMLYRTAVDEEGVARLDRVQTSNSSLRLGEVGKASMEIRCNRLSGEISLFANGEFVAQWNERENVAGNGEGYAGRGDGFGFVAQSDGSSVRVSEIMVAEWNGMPDSARSMQVDDADIVLLANGTDRFSGKVTGIEDGLLKLEGRFGDFGFPIGEIAEVHFAKSGLVGGEDSSEEIRVRFHPLGRVSGKPVGGDGNILRMRNAYAGEIDVRLDSAVMLEFRETNGFLDGWDDEF